MSDSFPVPTAETVMALLAAAPPRERGKALLLIARDFIRKIPHRYRMYVAGIAAFPMDEQKEQAQAFLRSLPEDDRRGFLAFLETYMRNFEHSPWN
jgi:hypothetical protein